MPIKTDRRDAEGIARLLHLGWFRPVHCKSVSAQEIRALLGARKSIQQGMIALEMSLRGLLRNFGLKVGAISKGRFDARIQELVASNTTLVAATEPMLRARATLRHELARLERHVRSLAQDDPTCRLLMTMPAVGAVVALTFKSAVDDPARFSSSKKVGPWVGLTPSRQQSGERDVTGGITKAGDAHFFENDPPMKRNAYIEYSVWNTVHDPEQRYAGGKFAMQSDGSDTLAEWVKKDQSLMGKDIVTWFSAGFHHIPRMEDWPVMSTEWKTVHIMPHNFFAHNPALTIRK